MKTTSKGVKLGDVSDLRAEEGDEMAAICNRYFF